MQVLPDDIAHLVDEQRIRREFERFRAMRLELDIRQMRLIVIALRPTVFAIERVLTEPRIPTENADEVRGHASGLRGLDKPFVRVGVVKCG